MQSLSTCFAPEVAEYMKLNGYRLVSHDTELDVLSFRREDVAVVFWQDRIERRIVSPDKVNVTRHLKSFKGFDGKNVFKLMLILHLLDAVDLKEVKSQVDDTAKGQFSQLFAHIAETATA